MRAYHQCRQALYVINSSELHIIKPKRMVFMHGFAVMIYRRERLMIYKGVALDDIPNLAILRFG